MLESLLTAVENGFSAARVDLEALVRIPSVSVPAYDPAEVHRSAVAIGELFERSGFSAVRLLEIDGAHPAVFAEIPAPPGAPSVLLYAHHDVQPPGPAEEWTSPPFEPTERSGRLYGRGVVDDKAGVVIHAYAVQAHDGTPPVGVKVFIEGEEEVASPNSRAFLERYGHLLEADVVVVADMENWRVGTPALTTSLRGLVDCTVEVRVLNQAVHSGTFGGAFPDALTVLARMLATLHDDRGEVAVAGLAHSEADPLDLSEEELKSQAGAVGKVQLIGSGSLTSRMWTKPACAVLAIDAPPVSEAINQLVPFARAKVSLRTPPGDDAALALQALTTHLESVVPWGAEVSVVPGEAADGIQLTASGHAHDAFRAALAESWGREPVEIGVGGSIPILDGLAAAYPDAAMLLTGVGDPTSATHGPDESVDLGELRRGILAEAIALQLLAGKA